MKDWQVGLLVGGGILAAGAAVYFLAGPGKAGYRATPPTLTVGPPAGQGGAPSTTANVAAVAAAAETATNAIGQIISGDDSWDAGDAVNSLFG